MYGTRCLTRWPTQEELNEVEKKYEKKRCLGCVGAIDCSDLIWKNCRTQDKGQYLNTKESKLASIQCEAWCDADLYCWHWNVGWSGTNNDLNVIMRSRLLKGIMYGRLTFRLPRSYCVMPNGKERTMPYLLGDRIYPDWPIIIKSIKESTNENECQCSENKEGPRKDIERLSGVFNRQFKIPWREIRAWELGDVVNIADTCIILHNFIVRMQQSGDFRDEGNGADMVTEFINDDVEKSMIAAVEYEDNRRRIREKVHMDWEQQIQWWIVNDARYMDYEGFVELETEFITYHREADFDWRYWEGQ